MKPIVKKIFSLLCICSLMSGNIVFANPAGKGAAIKRFEKKQYQLIFKSDMKDFPEEFTDVFSVSKKIDVYDSFLTDAKDNRKHVEYEHLQLNNKVDSLQKSIKILDEEIQTGKAKVKRYNIEINQTKKYIDANTIKIQTLNKKIDESEEILLEYLTYIYKRRNLAEGDTGIDNIKFILTHPEDINDFIDDLYFSQLIQVTGQRLIKDHKALLVQRYTEKVKLEKQKRLLLSLRTKVLVETKKTNDKKSYKEQLLKETKGKERLFKKFLEQKIKIENQMRLTVLKEKLKLKEMQKDVLKKYNCPFVDISKKTPETKRLEEENPRCFSINSMVLSEANLKQTLSLGANPLAWPVSPARGISAYFKDEEYLKIVGAPHHAIDVIIKQGTPIEAPMDGYVVYVRKPTDMDYSYVALKHPGGYVTVYGHLNETMVEPLQFVKKGEVFAKSGGEYGTKGAGYVTSGAHLHMEVFKDGQYIDPLKVLDLSYINPKKLAKKYNLKYRIDYRKRHGKNFEGKDSGGRTFKLTGKNEIERQQNFIKNYAAGDFKDWQIWVDESLEGNIDPTMVMCIGLAESSLGKNLTTRYNIGNVGNNDRGDRVGLSSAREGVRSIVQTLNNKYFTGINRLDKLSGAGRIVSGLPACSTPGEYCYATDPNHWHNNVTKCMSHIKLDYIPDDYNFRL